MHISIRVKGHLDQGWQPWLEGLQILHESDGTTVLAGHIQDQPALYGILNKLNHLGLTLLFLQSSEPMERGKTEYFYHDRLDRYKNEKKEQTVSNTGKITTSFSMSLDGFVAGPNEDFQHLFAWMTRGDSEYTIMIGEREHKLKIAEESVKMLDEAIHTAGALVAGRRLYELTHGWGGHHPIDAPVIVVTHRPPPEWVKQEWPVTFVTDGLERALEQAKVIAGDKSVAIASATIVQQCLNAGLLDEIHIDLVPFVLGDGVRLFEHLKVAPIALEDPRVSIGKGVIHLTYCINKEVPSDPPPQKNGSSTGLQL